MPSTSITRWFQQSELLWNLPRFDADIKRCSMEGFTMNTSAHESNNLANIKTIYDKKVSISLYLWSTLGSAKALLLDHIFFTFIYHYDNQDLPKFERHDHPGEGVKTWVYFTLDNFERNIPLVRSKIRLSLKELERDGWIECVREPGKKVLYRPNLRKFSQIASYQADCLSFVREPDRLVHPEAEGWGVPKKGTPPEDEPTVPKKGTQPCPKGARIPAQNGHGFHILTELIEEPSNLNSSARANPRVENEEPGTDPGTDPGAGPGTDPGADPGAGPGSAWEGDVEPTHEEKVQLVAKHYLEVPMSKAVVHQFLKQYGVTLEEVREEVARLEAHRKAPKTAAKPPSPSVPTDAK